MGFDGGDSYYGGDHVTSETIDAINKNVDDAIASEIKRYLADDAGAFISLSEHSADGGPCIYVSIPDLDISTELKLSDLADRCHILQCTYDPGVTSYMLNLMADGLDEIAARFRDAARAKDGL